MIDPRSRWPHVSSTSSNMTCCVAPRCRVRLTAPEEAARFDTLTELVVGEETLWLQGDGERVQAKTGPNCA